MVPSELAYGSRGSPPKIGPFQNLMFDIHLIAVEPDTSILARLGAPPVLRAFPMVTYLVAAYILYLLARYLTLLNPVLQVL